MNKKKLIFIINPISGTVKGKDLKGVIYDEFHSDEFDIDIFHTTHPGHASELAKSAKDLNANIVAVGGDGTINEVGKELLNSDSATMGIIPMGSGNGLARSLGIPLEVRAALQRLKTGTARLIDTCCFNQTPFFCTAGVAFDALVAKDFDELPTRGIKTYFQASYRQFVKYKPITITAKINGETITQKPFMLTVANAQQYGYGVKINPSSSLSDGVMEVISVEEMNLAGFAEFTLRLFLGTVPNFKHSKVIQTSEPINITTESTIAHLDGEPIEFNGTAVIRIHPKSLRIIS
ncbi:MAG: diacylglycerol kinase family protein [Flavobacteriales bacterium]